MKILVAGFAYNERPYIPYMVDFYRNQGCELLILDNYSTDGTYEWLVNNKVRTDRVDTNQSFWLHVLNRELTKHVNKLKPEWVIYTGIDLYYYFPNGIKKEIEDAHSKGFNMIEVDHFTACNTGEEFSLPFQDTFFYMAKSQRLQMVAYHGGFPFSFGGDRINIHSPKVYKSKGFLINYGQCKPKHEREITYKRRQKAWELGEPKQHGTHYKPAKERNWVWNKEELIDIRTTEYYKMMKP